MLQLKLFHTFLLSYEFTYFLKEAVIGLRLFYGMIYNFTSSFISNFIFEDGSITLAKLALILLCNLSHCEYLSLLIQLSFVYFNIFMNTLDWVAEAELCKEFIIDSYLSLKRCWILFFKMEKDLKNTLSFAFLQWSSPFFLRYTLLELDWK